jgi:hypothetical protein
MLAHRRLDTLSAGFYYAASTWPVIPGAQSFFQTGRHLGTPIVIWLVLAALGSLPWIGSRLPRSILIILSPDMDACACRHG